MIKYRCKICGGEYNNMTNDGLEYYHDCPNITDTEGNIIPRKNARNENIKALCKFNEREEI